MKCEDCQIHIEEYFDGELKETLAASVKSHIAACNECSPMWDELQREQEIYLRYQRDVEVTPALWAAVQAKIAQERSVADSPGLFDRLKAWFGSTLAAPRMSLAYTAALVLIAVGATVAVMSYINSGGKGTGELAVVTPNTGAGAPAPPAQSSGENPTVAPNTSPQSGNNGDVSSPNPANPTQPTRKVPRKPPAQPTPEQLVREAEQKYIAAIAILTRDVNKRRSDLDPAVAARFDTALAAIDHTIAETRQAARRNPNDPMALQYMLAAYAKKVEVLRDIADD